MMRWFVVPEIKGSNPLLHTTLRIFVMGMYTELVISTRIVDDPQVIAILKYMIGKTEEKPELPDHPLFLTDRWDRMLNCCSYYFTPAVVHYLEYDKIGENWSFISRSDFKNYDNEVRKFFDWIDDYIDCSRGGEMIGYSRYEESDEPQIWYTQERG